MGARIRTDGRVFCAAMHAEKVGDLYLDDALLYDLSMLGVLVTEPMDQVSGRGGHAQHGEWWWRWNVPSDALLEDRAYYPGAATKETDDA